MVMRRQQKLILRMAIVGTGHTRFGVFGIGYLIAEKRDCSVLACSTKECVQKNVTQFLAPVTFMTFLLL